jgi:hypothetical protein
MDTVQFPSTGVQASSGLYPPASHAKEVNGVDALVDPGSLVDAVPEKRRPVRGRRPLRDGRRWASRVLCVDLENLRDLAN